MAVVAFAADASGTWKWTQQGRGGGGGKGGGGGGGKGGGGQPQEITLTLVAKDGKLTGKLSQPGRGGGEPVVTEISAASIKGDDVAFSIERDFNGTKFVTKYMGKLDGDSIKGSIERPGFNGGEATKTDWEAKRSK